VTTLNNIWIKQLGGNFDVAMGSFNGPEVCDNIKQYMDKAVRRQL